MIRLFSLKPLKASFATATIRRFTADSNSTPPPDSSCPIFETVSLLGSSHPSSWPTNPKLRDLLSALSPPSVLKITRQLPRSQNALDFLRYLKTTPDLSDSAPFAFQAILQLTIDKEPDDHPEKLYELFAMAKEENIPISLNAGSLLIRCFSRANMLEEMLAVFDSMNGKVKNTHVMNLILNGMIKLHLFDDALNLLDEMLQRDAPCPADKNTAIIFFSSVLFTNSASRLSAHEIYNILSLFGKRGIHLRKFWLSGLIYWFYDIGECQKAWSVLCDGKHFGANAKVSICNGLLTELGKKRDYDRMNSLIEEMEAKGIEPNVMTYGIMIKYLCEMQRLGEALEVLEKMIDGQTGVEPDVVIYNSLIEGLCKAGRQDVGMQLIEKMRLPESNCKPDASTYNCLMDAFCEAGDIDKGLELFQLMIDHGVEVDVVTLNTMVGALCRDGRVRSAIDLFLGMRDERGVEGDTDTYTMLITALCEAEQLEIAMQLYEEMKANGLSPNVAMLFNLISGYCHAMYSGD